MNVDTPAGERHQDQKAKMPKTVDLEAQRRAEKERPVEVRRPKQKLPQNPIEREKYLLLRCPSLLSLSTETPFQSFSLYAQQGAGFVIIHGRSEFFLSLFLLAQVSIMSQSSQKSWFLS